MPESNTCAECAAPLMGDECILCEGCFMRALDTMLTDPEAIATEQFNSPMGRTIGMFADHLLEGFISQRKQYEARGYFDSTRGVQP